MSRSNFLRRATTRTTHGTHGYKPPAPETLILTPVSSSIVTETPCHLRSCRMNRMRYTSESNLIPDDSTTRPSFANLLVFFILSQFAPKVREMHTICITGIPSQKG